MTRGISLNNPMNIMHYDTIHWQGEIVPTSDPEGRLCQFDTMQNGLRAGIDNLKNKQEKHGLNTWNEIIPVYAPPEENDTAAYIKAMCDGTGVSSDEQLNLHDPDFLALATKTMILHEQGSYPCSADMIAAEVQVVLGIGQA